MTASQLNVSRAEPEMVHQDLVASFQPQFVGAEAA